MSQRLRINTSSFDRDDIRAVLLEYSKKTGKAIEVNYARNWDVKPRDSGDNTLYIHILGSPGRTDILRLKEIYGYAVPDIMNMRPTGANLILYDDTNTPIAEYIDNNLYILFDFPEVHRQHVSVILDKLLNELDYNLNSSNTPEEIAKRLHKLLLVSVSEPEYKSASELRELDDELKRLRAQMVKKMVRHRIVSDRRALAKKMEDGITESLAVSIYEELKALSNGQELSVMGNEINIPLGEVKINHNGKTFLIGNIVLVINLKGQNGTVRCINKEGSQSGHPHPFADDNGNLYLGAISDSVAKLIGEIELVPIVSIVSEYLQTYDESEARLPVENWPSI